MTSTGRPEGFSDSSAALSAIDAVGHFVGLLDLDGVLLEANAAALAAGGLRRQDVIGKPFWDAAWWSYDPEVQQDLRDAIRRAAEGESVGYLVPVRAPGMAQQLLPIHFTLTPLRDPEGTIRFLVPEGHPIHGEEEESSVAWAELVAQTRRAREESELLRHLATALAAADDLDSIARVIVENVAAAVGVDFANVAIRVDDERVQVFQPDSLPRDIASRWEYMPTGASTPLTDAIRTGEVVVVGDAAAIAERYPAMAADAAAAGLTCLSAYPVRDGRGRPEGAIGLGAAHPDGHDPTRIEPVMALCGAALRRGIALQRMGRSTALLDTLVQRAPIGFGYHDTDLRWVSVNEVLAGINGIPAEAHIGKTVPDLLPEIADKIEPVIRSVLETGEAVNHLRVQGRTAASASTRIWDASYFPVRGGDGTVHGVGTIVEDITDRMAWQHEVTRLNERLRLAMAASEAGVYEWVPDTGEMEWTPEFASLYGFEPGATPSHARWVQAIHPEDRGLVVARADEGDEFRREFRIRNPMRGERWVESVANIRRHPDGTVASVVGIDIDITDRKRHEIALAGIHTRQRDIAQQLQEGMLPTAFPDVERFAFSGRYQAAAEGLTVGGDWYDVIRVDDRDVVLMVGDVVGHDLDAAVTMAQVWHGALGLTFAHRDPVEVLAALDNLARLNPGILASTLLYGRLDTETNELCYVLAGHPPPLIIGADREPAFDGGETATPLGVPSDRPVRRLTLQPGQTLIAYTDGLIEHRERSHDAALEHLLTVVRDIDPRSPLDEITQHLLETTPHAGHRDDIALLAVRRDA